MVMMHLKPATCQGCPAYSLSRYYVPDEIQAHGSVVVYGQNPGSDEEAGRRYLGNGQYESARPAPFIGKTGRMLEGTFLPLAGLSRAEVSLANTIRCRWGPSNTLPSLPTKDVQQAIRHCTLAHWRPPVGPGGSRTGLCYVAMGEYATYALTGLLKGFSGWRGYLMPKRHPWEPPRPMTEVWTPAPQEDKVFVTHHLAYLFREPTASLPAKRDWNKLATILKGDWPVKMSPTESKPPDPWPSYAAFDTEFAEDHPHRLIRYSLATRDRRVWVVEASHAQRVSPLPGTRVVMHNAPADLPHLQGLMDTSQVDIEDTMYAHACLWTGKVETDDQKGQTGGAMSHTLNFLGSLYAQINRWKHLVHVAPRLYAGGDAMGTMDVWETGLNGGLKGELDRDPETKWVYEHLQKPLIPIVLKHHQRGIATDPAKVKIALAAISDRQAGYTQHAQAYTGWPINLRSPKHLAYWLYDVEKLKVRRTRHA